MASLIPTRMTPEMAEARIARLQTLNVAELRREWTYLFGTQPYTTNNRSFLIKRLTWRINTLVNGGISERAMKRARLIADETLVRMRVKTFKTEEVHPVDPATLDADMPANLLSPGSVIRRVFKGKMHEVTILNGGKFAYEGNTYNDLTSVAWRICGYPKSGNAFFNLPTNPRKKK